VKRAKRAIITIAALLALGVTATSSAADTATWIRYPTCTATTTALSCTGRAAGLKVNDPNWAPLAELWAVVRYSCSEDPQVSGYTGADGHFAASRSALNGLTFSLTYAPGIAPTYAYAADGRFFTDPTLACPSGNWIRNQNYYDVSVAISQGFWATHVLSAYLGTVTP
jgi:hypothetical protein